jgi:hypothetical protein
MVMAMWVALLPALAADTDPAQWSTADGGNGHWYQLSPREVEGLDDAIQLAASTTWLGQPGYVVSVLSEGEKDFLVSRFGDEAEYVIGYTDRDNEGVWKWVSGEPSGFTFWASGEPNDFQGEDYAVMNWQHEPDPEVPEPPGAWNDLGGAWGYAIFEYDVLAVSVDIMPGGDTNPVNPVSKGVISVAILTTADFDATTVDPQTVTFGPAGAPEAHGRGHVEDVDQDGDVDLLFHFRTQETGLQPGDTEACLAGETLSGNPFQGCDAITVK